jgi:regulation of enolase protein 1 (concanavalin A-like superfamily)
MVKVAGDFGHAEDKAGIMARLDDQTWVHAGLEMGKDGKLHHFTCVTRDYTDRSTSPLPQERIERTNGVWICMKRMGNAFETFYSFDAMKWDQSRQGLFTERPVLQVGLCGACPSGKEFSVVFDQYRVKTI